MFNIDIAMSAGDAGLMKAFEIKQTNYQVTHQILTIEPVVHHYVTSQDFLSEFY